MKNLKLIVDLIKTNLLVWSIILSFTNAYSQTTSVSGTVTDSNGIHLPGVNVIVKGMTLGASTDFDGYYILNSLPSDASNLIFSSVGMTTQ